jgi:hypothetical protein
MTRKKDKAPKGESEAERLRAKEDQDRLAGNATSAAEKIIDRQKHAEMNDEEKLQERIDDLMRRTP